MPVRYVCTVCADKMASIAFTEHLAAAPLVCYRMGQGEGEGIAAIH